MRDSRIGTYGTCALILSLMLRWSTLAEIAEPRLVAVALIAAHVSARAVLPIVMSFVPPARADGLSSGAGQPPQQSAAIALALGTICLLFSFGPSGALMALLALGAIGLLLTRLAIKAIGGPDRRRARRTRAGRRSGGIVDRGLPALMNMTAVMARCYGHQAETRVARNGS